MPVSIAASISVTPLSPVLGGRVEGVDLRRPVDAETARAIREAFLACQVLCFPGQRLSADDQIRFCGLFGRADSDYKRPGGIDSGYSRGVMLVSNVRKDGKPIGNLPDGDMQFHSDGSHRECPYRATTLYAIRIPSTGGDTLFANLYAAYDALPEATRARIEGLRVRNVYLLDATHRDVMDRTEAERLRSASHPVARVHGETGRKALYVNRLMSREIEGLPPAEGEALLAELIDVTERPELIYAHRWTPGDLLIWDNRCVNHARTDFPADEIRLLRRYTVSEAA